MMTMIAAMAAGCGNAQNDKPKPGGVVNMGVENFAEKMADSKVVLVDVRTPKEYAEGHIAGAENIDMKSADFVERVTSFRHKVAVYCRGGKRSLTAAKRLADKGVMVYNLDGGIFAWQKAGMPTTTVETDVFVTPGGKLVKIHALLHSSIRIEYDGQEIEVDPCANLNDRTVDYAAFPKADIILVTHEHFDHLDTATLRLLTTEKTQLVMNGRSAGIYSSGTAMANGERLQLADDITIEAVPAYNTTEGHRQFHPKGRDNGYILTLDGLRIYIAGDTEDIPEMADIKDIDIAFLPCNQPYTMTPEQLVNAARVIKPKVLFPYHYAETDITALPAQLRPDGIDVRIRHYE